MNTHANKTQENKSQSVVNSDSPKRYSGKSAFQFIDNRPESIVQKKLKMMANNSSQKKKSPGPGNDSGKVVQREINRVYLADDQTVRITHDNDRPQGNLRGHTGDHTTPYITFDHQIIAAVEGQDLPTAWNSLLATYEAIRRMPGYNASPYVNQFEQLRAVLRGQNAANIGVQEILDFGNRIIEVRNMLKYTAYHATGGSTGGQNEAAAAGLLEEERRIRKGHDPQYTRDQVMTTMWAIFDHIRMNRSIPDDEKDSVLLQHRMSMLDTYWRLAQAYNITDARLRQFYQAHY